MKTVTSFSDKLLIQAAIDYSYRMSRYDIHQDPIVIVKEMIKVEFTNRYKVVLFENKPLIRKNKDGIDKTIDLRYLIVEDTRVDPVQHALIFQGSDTKFESVFSGKETDWSNNLSVAVHLPVNNLQNAKDEYEYLKSLNKYNITASAGNSLGGGYALVMADIDSNLRIIGVNPSPPEAGRKFKASKNSTIINTSTDLLTRMLKTDITRYKPKDFAEIKQVVSLKDRSVSQKTKDFDLMIRDINYDIGYYYGLETYSVKRSLYYNDAMYIEAAHRGTVLEPREVAIDIFRQNMVAYSAGFVSNIFSKTKELLDYSKYFIKLNTNVITNEEYRDLIDNYIEPAFLPIHQNKLNDYREFASLATFIQYDLKSGDLINDDGKRLNNEKNYKIEEKNEFINNLSSSIRAYQKSIKYPLNRVMHDMDEEYYLNSEENDLSQTMTFFAASFNITLNFDLDIVNVFRGVPLTLLVKIAELLDQNRRYLKGLKSNLITHFSENNKKLTEPQLIEHYRYIYNTANKIILNNSNIIVENITTLKDNLAFVLNNDVSMALIFRIVDGKKAIKHFKLIKPITLDQYLIESLYDRYGENLVLSQYEKVLDIIDDYRISSVLDLNENIKKTEDIVKSGVSFIEKVSSREKDYRLNKLSSQLQAMLNNVDLETIYYNSLNVFRKDIAAVALRNTVGQSIMTHYLQMTETNEQLLKMLENLKIYININTSSITRDYLLRDLEKIVLDIKELNKFIKSFVE